MTDEERNLAWKCLPKEARDEIRSIVKDGGMGIHGMFDLVFGGNVTSETEPKEMLFVKREDVIKLYLKAKEASISSYSDDINWGIWRINLLETLFNDKCLPDKESQQEFQERILCNPDRPTDEDVYRDLTGEIPLKEEQTKPKFEEGQVVICEGKVCRVLEYNSGSEFPYIIHKLYNNAKTYVLESDLIPYTEEKKPERTRKNEQELSLSDEELDNIIFHLIRIRDNRRESKRELTEVLAKLKRKEGEK